MFPEDDHRLDRTWTLMEKLTNFVVKAPSDLIGIQFEGISEVSIVFDSRGYTSCSLMY